MLRILFTLGSLSSGCVQASELYDAVMQDDLERVQVLIAAGTDVDDLGLAGTPLHFAVVRDSVAIAQALFDAGADLEAVDDSGARALHTAIRSDALAAAALLIVRGAEVKSMRGRA